MRGLVYLVLEALLVMVLLGFFTLVERKSLGLGQMRKGPNKAVLWGLMQPILDGVKLFMKGFWGSGTGGYFSLWGCPFVGLVLVLILWAFLGVFEGVMSMSAVLFLVVLLGAWVGVSMFVAGYFSGGKYSMLGGVRALVQVISYEGILVLGLLTVLLFSGSASELFGVCYFTGLMVVGLLIVAVVMENNRTPVDFVEGESELVSGLMTELGGLSFSLVFLMEYGVMSFYSMLMGLVLLGSEWYMMGWVVVALMMVGVLCVLRLSLPRSRYDLNMIWGWKVSLISGFLLFILIFGLMAEL
uniref:NADH-ubiquinone oxidoreductase chain 1 n=1 Tax=Plagiorhynchus transversus TaxID=1795586 RepID=A0A140E9N2_9BILA|nr:NADH dehydrogenase subunit 1 [Plagiorhynchus transversus]AMK97083.1 NADH dehydrogenase subunit 1 [Plagiorhynchus transversus]